MSKCVITRTFFRNLSWTFARISAKRKRGNGERFCFSGNLNTFRQKTMSLSSFRRLSGGFKWLKNCANIGRVKNTDFAIRVFLNYIYLGPISVTLYVTDPEFQECQKFIENSEILQDRLNVAYHVVFKDGEYYPINILRNVGLANVNTPYVFLADIDFLPMHMLYSVLKNHLGSIKDINKKVKKVFIYNFLLFIKKMLLITGS